MKKKILSAILLSALAFLPVYGADVENIEAINNETVKVITSSDVVVPEGKIEGKVEVLKDLMVSYAYKNPENLKKITVNLTYDLLSSKNYALMGVLGVDADMKFTTSDKILGEVPNTSYNPGTLSIEKLVIVDTKTIDIYYNKDIEAEDLSYKVLQEIPVTSIHGNGLNTVSVNVSEGLETLTPYLVIFGDINDIDGEVVNFSEAYYAFQTGDRLETTNESIVNSEANKSVIPEEKKKEKEGNVEEVALNSAATPPTGPATWVLLLLTFCVSAGFLVKNRFFK